MLHASTLRNAGFRHAFTTRSSGDFATLRDPAPLRTWQEALAKEVGFDRSRFYQTKQVHGRTVTVVDADQDPADLLKVEADGIVGTREGDAVAIRVADCVPILLAATDTGKVAAVHAGWRGVEAKILDVAVARLDSPRASIIAAVGPSIGPCCFEVGDDVARRIGDPFVVRREGDKAFVDLRAAVRAQLTGIAVEDVPGCTRCEPDGFHSYRRDGDASGRLVGVIVARTTHP